MLQCPISYQTKCEPNHMEAIVWTVNKRMGYCTSRWMCVSTFTKENGWVVCYNTYSILCQMWGFTSFPWYIGIAKTPHSWRNLFACIPSSKPFHTFELKYLIMCIFWVVRNSFQLKHLLNNPFHSHDLNGECLVSRRTCMAFCWFTWINYKRMCFLTFQTFYKWT